jgi:hypothetical protein
MRDSNRNVVGRMIPVLLAVALVGYLLGVSRSAPRAASTLVVRTATAFAPFVLEYPSTPGWSVAPVAPKLPGLAIDKSLVLAPVGRAHEAGMIVGEVPAESSLPLPTPLLARLREVPKAEVVSLLDTQAYRYGRLIPSGTGYELTLYTVPRVAGSIAVIVCYALSSADSAYLNACEQLVGNLAVHIEGESEIQPPEVGYARQIGEVVTRVDRLRLVLRSAMSRQAAPARQTDAATRLAKGFGEASRSLAMIQAPPAAEWAQAAVSRGLAEAQGAYLALAAAARTHSPSSYEQARARISTAETSIVAALRRYALLGYG